MIKITKPMKKIWPDKLTVDLLSNASSEMRSESRPIRQADHFEGNKAKK